MWDVPKKAGAPLDRAVASSCAVPGIFAPITINGRRYVDGGMIFCGTNADLAKGHDLVLIVSLMGASRLGATTDPRMERYRRRMDHELMVLTDAGGSVELLAPDDEAAEVLGVNLMDPTPHARGRRDRHSPRARGRPNCSATSGSRSALKFPLALSKSFTGNRQDEGILWAE